MRVQTNPPIVPAPRTGSTLPANTAPAPHTPDPQDKADIQPQKATPPVNSAKQAWRKLGWASFAGQAAGAALVFTHQGPVGLGIFAASSALMVYAGYKEQRA